MGFWSGFIIGLFVGACVGLFTLSLCVAAKRGDEQLKGGYTYRE